MKLKLIKYVALRNYWRRLAVALTLSVLVSFGLLPAAAQLKQKRITSVFTTTTAEGSRVTVASDSPLNDYEAYRRGDRFYVRIPLADLPSARGSLLGRGFDDVQIQRYGDGIIFSFRLQPGTTAHVAQASNRLDVIFSTPGRSQNAGAASADRGEVANRTRARRTGDSSGPTPPSSTGVKAPAYGAGERYSARESGSSNAARYRRGNGSKRSASKAKSRNYASANRTKRTASSSNTPSTFAKAVRPTSETAAPSTSPGLTPSSTTTTQPGASSAASPAGPSSFSSASPVAGASPSASASSVASASSASPYNTPASSPTPTGQKASSVSTQTPASASPGSASTDWASRIRYYKLWARLNWLPLLIGGLVVLCLLVLLLSSRRAKRKGVVRVTPAKQQATKPPVPVATASEAQTRSSLVSLPAKDKEPAANDQEREVFEL
jgi:hypothetical protein